MSRKEPSFSSFIPHPFPQTSLALIQAINRRSWRPTSSIGCCRSRRRTALNMGALGNDGGVRSSS
jgi:hypothetical protein